METRNLTVIALAMVAVVASCRQGKAPAAGTTDEDRSAKAMLQGIWLDEETENVVFKVEGDSVFYPDSTSIPLYFKIVGDTLIMGSNESKYPIMKQSTETFWFGSPTGVIVKLVKSNDPNSTYAFVDASPQPIVITEVQKHDTVVMHEGERYHCYTAINPTEYKVIRKTYNDDGVEVENIYYDNIIHISVFHGAEQVYSRDFRKTMFASFVPEHFLEQAILNNMTYNKVDAEGFHFNAMLCIPDAASCYMLDTKITFDGEMHMELIDY